MEKRADRITRGSSFFVEIKEFWWWKTGISKFSEGRNRAGAYLNLPATDFL
jgi:hypothetical protein